MQLSWYPNQICNWPFVYSCMQIRHAVQILTSAILSSTECNQVVNPASKTIWHTKEFNTIKESQPGQICLEFTMQWGLIDEGDTILQSILSYCNTNEINHPNVS